jgi:excisionase family DNA binding protein
MTATTTRRRPKPRAFRRKPAYTTGDLAILTGLSAATIARLIDRGEIRGWKVPGSRKQRVERRVGEQELRAWLTRHPGMEDILARLERAT